MSQNKATPPPISVILPVRNGGATIRRAVDSILGQTFPDFELVLVDDCSTDDSTAIIRSYTDARIRLIYSDPPGGLVPALNLATEQARGAFLARMDADDYAYPARLEQQFALLRKRPDLAGCGTLVRITGKHAAEGFIRYGDWLNSLVKPEDIRRERFIESPLVHPSVMLRRTAFDAVGGYTDPSWAEDYDLWLRMIDAGMRFAKVSEILLDWHDGPRRLTRTEGRYSAQNFLRAKAQYLARIPLVCERGVTICGAGPTGKTMARFLQKHRITIHGFLDVHQNRVGERIRGAPVRFWKDIQPANEEAPVQLAAVGQPDRRDPVRELIVGAGYTEGVNFFCIA